MTAIEPAMREERRQTITRWLREWQDGDSAALSRLAPEVYGELRNLAARVRSPRGSKGTLQTTALVHEAYLQLIDQRVRWQSRRHFYGVAATLMRRSLLRYLERQQAAKRGGHLRRVSFDERIHLSEQQADELLRLGRALSALREIDGRQASLVELRFFVGLGIAEIAELFEVSATTVKREWRLARAWLQREMEGQEGSR